MERQRGPSGWICALHHVHLANRCQETSAKDERFEKWQVCFVYLTDLNLVPYPIARHVDFILALGGRCNVLNNPSADGLQTKSQYPSKGLFVRFVYEGGPLLQKSRLAMTSSPVSSSYAYRICRKRLAKSVSSWWNFGGNAHLPSARM